MIIIYILLYFMCTCFSIELKSISYPLISTYKRSIYRRSIKDVMAELYWPPVLCILMFIPCIFFLTSLVQSF
jgi:hypothetical protein